MKCSLAIAIICEAFLFLERGEPVTESAAFAPGKPALPEVKGPCAVDPCGGANCCCWSTLAEEPHPDYPDDEVPERKRNCLNPPRGFVLAKAPGYVTNDGHYDMLPSMQLPTYDNRDLCCTLSELDTVAIMSQNTAVETVLASTTTTTTTTTSPPTTSTTTAAPTTTVVTTTAAPVSAEQQLFNTLGFDDNAVAKLEQAAGQQQKSAAAITDAASKLQDTVSAMGNPRVLEGTAAAFKKAFG